MSREGLVVLRRIRRHRARERGDLRSLHFHIIIESPALAPAWELAAFSVIHEASIAASGQVSLLNISQIFLEILVSGDASLDDIAMRERVPQRSVFPCVIIKTVSYFLV